VIHEVHGLRDDIRATADRFSGEGFEALAVDLFTGRNRAVCMARFFAGLLARPFDNLAIRDLKVALTWLGDRPEVDSERLGAIGFCMGGGFAIAWACTDARLRVIAPFYGMNPRPLGAVRRGCPIVGSYPGKDFTARHGRKLDAELAAAGVPHDVKIYPGAKHSFANTPRTDAEREAAEDAFARTLAFFREHLRPAA